MQKYLMGPSVTSHFFKKGQLEKPQGNTFSKQCKQSLKQTQNPVYSHFSPLAVLKSFHSKNISMNSKDYTTVGGKRRKHLHLDVPQAFIPELAWFKVMLYVATQSSEDFFRMASVCPLFNTLANTPQVWNTISMEKYPDNPNWYYNSTQVRHFVEQCRACENPEAIFREAFNGFFRLGNVEALSGMRVAGTPYGSGICSWTTWHVRNWSVKRGCIRILVFFEST
ncbi:unnamed protein product [Prunus brigantina]